MRKFLGTGITVLLFVSTVIAGCAALYNVFHPGFFGGLPARKIAWTSLVLLGSWFVSRVIDRIAVGMSRGQQAWQKKLRNLLNVCLLYTSPSPRDKRQSRMPSSA